MTDLPRDPLPRWWLDHAAAIGRAIAHGGDIPEAQHALTSLAVAIPYPPPPYGPHTVETLEDHWRAVRQDRRRFARHIAGQAYKNEKARIDAVQSDIARMAYSAALAGRDAEHIKAEALRIAAGSITNEAAAAAAVPAALAGWKRAGHAQRRAG